MSKNFCTHTYTSYRTSRVLEDNKSIRYVKYVWKQGLSSGFGFSVFWGMVGKKEFVNQVN